MRPQSGWIVWLIAFGWGVLFGLPLLLINLFLGESLRNMGAMGVGALTAIGLICAFVAGALVAFSSDSLLPCMLAGFVSQGISTLTLGYMSLINLLHEDALFPNAVGTSGIASYSTQFFVQVLAALFIGIVAGGLGGYLVGGRRAAHEEDMAD